MAKTTRSTETLVAAIQQQLAEAAGDGNAFCAASWSEADSVAGYVLHADGRMVGLGDYQYGFSTLAEMLDPNLDAESAGWARSEAGRIAGSMEPIDLDAMAQGDDDLGLMEWLPYAFQVDGDLVEAAVKQGKVSFEHLFDLLAAIPGKLIQAGATNVSHEITPKEDLVVARARQADDGSVAWEQVVVAKAGEKLSGFASGEYAQVNVPGGHVHLTADQVDATPLNPTLRRCGGPH